VFDGVLPNRGYVMRPAQELVKPVLDISPVYVGDKRPLRVLERYLTL
jgi:hypothetical protein